MHEDTVHVFLTANLLSVSTYEKRKMSNGVVKCTHIQSLLDAKDRKQFEIPTEHVKQSLLQHLWFNTIVVYNGKAACRPNIKVRRTIKLENIV